MATRMQKCSACGKKCRSTLNMCPTCHPVEKELPRHTPGPWEFGRPPAIPGVKTISGWFFRAAGKGHDIGEVYKTASQDEAIQEANARLIAIAPELCEEALWVVRLFGTTNPQGMVELKEHVSKLNVLLVKAKAG